MQGDLKSWNVEDSLFSLGNVYLIKTVTITIEINIYSFNISHIKQIKNPDINSTYQWCDFFNIIFL